MWTVALKDVGGSGNLVGERKKKNVGDVVEGLRKLTTRFFVSVGE